MKFKGDDLPVPCQDTSLQSNQNSWRIGSSPIPFDRYELSLRNFGLNLFQAQTFGLWDNEHYKHK